MPVSYPPLFDWDGALNGSNAVTESVSRTSCSATSVVLSATGIMTCVLVKGYAGQIVTNMTVRWGGTAASGPQHWWLALYDTVATPAFIGQTADQTTTAISTNTSSGALALVNGPFTLTQTGWHTAGIMVAVTTTMPTMQGASTPNALSGIPVTGQKRIVGSNGSALTATAPAGPITVTTLASTNGVPSVTLS